MRGLDSPEAATLPDDLPPPELARQLESDMAGLWRGIGSVREAVTRAGHLHPGIERQMTDVLHQLITMSSHLRSMETVLSAKKATGALTQPPRQAAHAELELVALADATRQRMVESLHRAGDHTQDPEEVGA